MKPTFPNVPLGPNPEDAMERIGDILRFYNDVDNEIPDNLGDSEVKDAFIAEAAEYCGENLFGGGILAGRRTNFSRCNQMLEMLGFIVDDLILTAAGNAYLNAMDGDDSDAANNSLAEALRNYSVPEQNDADQISNPYRILLRLIEHNPGMLSTLASFAAEPRDNSQAEFDRVNELIRFDGGARNAPAYHLGGSDGRMMEIINDVLGNEDRQVTRYDVQNKRQKMLQLGRACGDIVELQDGIRNYLTLRNQDVNAGNLPEILPPIRRLRCCDLSQVGVISDFESDEQESLPIAPTTPGERAAARQLRHERTRRHHLLVHRWAKKIVGGGYPNEMGDRPFDLLNYRADGADAILTEAKTLGGDAHGEVERVREALAQLLYYEYFNVPEYCDEHDVQIDVEDMTRVALFEHPITDEHVVFLSNHDIVVVWEDEDEFTGPPVSQEHVIIGAFLGA